MKKEERLSDNRGKRHGRSRARGRRQRKRQIWKAILLIAVVGVMSGILLFTGRYLISPKIVVKREEARIIESQTLPQDGDYADNVGNTGNNGVHE